MGRGKEKKKFKYLYLLFLSLHHLSPLQTIMSTRHKRKAAGVATTAPTTEEDDHAGKKKKKVNGNALLLDFLNPEKASAVAALLISVSQPDRAEIRYRIFMFCLREYVKSGFKTISAPIAAVNSFYNGAWLEYPFNFETPIENEPRNFVQIIVCQMPPQVLKNMVVRIMHEMERVGAQDWPLFLWKS